MAKDYLTEFLPDLEEFKEKTIKFHNKEMTVPQYKGFSGGYGSYAEREGKPICSGSAWRVGRSQKSA